VTTRKRWGALVIALVVGSAAVSLLFCGGVFYVMFVGVERESVSVPAMNIDVVDEEGAAVPGARVSIEHRTEPHGRLEERFEISTDEAGRATTDLSVVTERVFPLCMHGVPAHRHFVCVDHPGATPVVMEVASTEVPLDITVPLRRDPSHSHACGQDLDTMLLTARTPRSDVSANADHVFSASEP
jgi:hypothetical protein